MKNRNSLIKALKAYQPFDPTEAQYIPRFLELLREEDCYHRSSLHGHLTASVWITDKQKQQVLLLHHKKLDKWLQPGGHADGDENLVSVAIRELQEETGLEDFEMKSINIFDLDIHTIPEHKGVPAHEHFDVRFLVTADSADSLIQNHESHALRWFPLNNVPYESSMLRMVAKLRKLS